MRKAYSRKISHVKRVEIGRKTCEYICYPEPDQNTLEKILDHPSEALKIDGFYSFIVKDMVKGTTAVAVDPFSLYPVFYSRDHCFSFRLPYFTCQEVAIDIHALRDYLTYRYIASPRTFFSDWKRMEPGTYKLFSRKGNILESIRTDLFNLFTVKNADIEKYYFSKIKRFLENCGFRNASVFLSGGMDSSAVTAMLSDITEKLSTWSVVFPGLPFDESEWSETVAEKFRTDHNKCSFSVSDIREHLSDMYDIFDQPVSSHTAALYRGIAERSRDEMLFTGGGGDEIFGGDIKYAHSLKLHRFASHMKRYGIDENISGFEVFSDFISFFDTGYLRHIVGNDLLDAMTGYNLRYWQPDYENYIMSQICHNSGSCYLTPLLLPSAVRYINSLHSELKIRGDIQRFVYRKYMEKDFGRRFAWRHSQGFSAPLNGIFRGEMRDEIGELIDSLADRSILKDGIIPASVIRQTLTDLDKGSNVYNEILILITLESFLKGMEKNENSIYLS